MGTVKDYAMQFIIKAKDVFSPTMKKAAANAVTSANTIAGADAKMAASSGRLSSALGVQSAAHKKAQMSAKSYSLSLSTMMNSAAGAAAASVAASAAIVAGLAKIAMSAADAGDAIFDLSRKFGLTTEFVSRMKFVAEQSGSSVESLGTAIRTLSKNAATGSAQFVKWGVGLTDASGKVRTSEELFFAAVESINALESSTMKTAAAQDLFGRSGTDLLQVIHLGRDGIEELMHRSDELGNTMASGTAVQANQFNNKLHETSTAVGALTREFGERMIPTFEAYIRKATDVVNWVRKNTGAFRAMLSTIAPISAVIEYNVGVMGKLADVLGWTKEVTTDAAKSEKALADQMDTTNKVVTAQEQKILSTSKAIKKLSKDIYDFGTKNTVSLAPEFAAEEAAYQRLQTLYAKRTALVNEHAEYRRQMAIKAGNDEVEQGELLAQKEAERLRERGRLHEQVATGMATAMGEGFAQMILDSENAGKHFAMTVIDAAQTAVMAYAAAGAAASAAANAGIPGIGWIMAIAGSTAMFGLIKGLLNEIPSYREGGIVQAPMAGGRALVAAHDNERILTVEQTGLFERMVAALEGGRGQQGGGVHLHHHNVIPQSNAQTMRQVRSVNKMQLRLQRLGMA